ncbi:MAG: hypothetical protein J2P18_17650, partial [Nocardia sp.]|nr:hypothetical protein [Nocardia sp.]
TRAGRIGEVFGDDGKTIEYKSQKGRAVVYMAADDALFDASDPYTSPIVEHYNEAYKADAEKSTPQSRDRLAVREQWLGDLAHHLQQAAHPNSGSHAAHADPQPGGSETAAPGRTISPAAPLAPALTGKLTAAPASGSAAASVLEASRSAPVSTVAATVAAAHAAPGGRPVPVHWIASVGDGQLQLVHGNMVHDNGSLTLRVCTSTAPADLVPEASAAAIPADQLHAQLTRQWAGFGGHEVRVQTATGKHETVARWDIPLSDTIATAVAQLDNVDATTDSASDAINALDATAAISDELTELLDAALTAGRGLFAKDNARGKTIDELKSNMGNLPTSVLKHEAAVALAAVGNQSRVCRRRLGEQAATQVGEITAVLTADSFIDPTAAPAKVALKSSDTQSISKYLEMVEAHLPKDDPRYSRWLATTKKRLKNPGALSRTDKRQIAIGISDLVNELADNARNSTVVTLEDGEPVWHLPPQRTTESDGAHGRMRLARELADKLRKQPVRPEPADPGIGPISDIDDIAAQVWKAASDTGAPGPNEITGRWIVKDDQAQPDLREWEVRAETDGQGVLRVSVTAHAASEDATTGASDGVTAIDIHEVFGRLTRAWVGHGGHRVEVTGVDGELMSWDIAATPDRDRAVEKLRQVESAVRAATVLPSPGQAWRTDANIESIYRVAGPVVEALGSARELFAPQSAIADRFTELIEAVRATNLTAAQAKEITAYLAIVGDRVVTLRHLLGVEAENATGRIAQLAGTPTSGRVDVTGATREEMLSRADHARKLLADNDPRRKELDQVCATLLRLDADQESGGLEVPGVAATLNRILNDLLKELRARPSTVFRSEGDTVIWTAAADTADSAADDNITALLAAHEAVGLDVAWHGTREEIIDSLLDALNPENPAGGSSFDYDGVKFRRGVAVTERNTDGGQEKVVRYQEVVSLADLLADPEEKLAVLREQYGLDDSSSAALAAAIQRFHTLDGQRRISDHAGALRHYAQVSGVSDTSRVRQVHDQLIEDIDNGRAAKLFDTLKRSIKADQVRGWQLRDELDRFADSATDPKRAREQYRLLADLMQTDRGRSLLDDLASAVRVQPDRARALVVELAFAAGVACGRQQQGADQETLVRLSQWCQVYSLLSVNQSAYLSTGKRLVDSPHEAIGREGTELSVASYLAGAHKEFIGTDQATAFKRIAERLGCGPNASLEDRIGASGRKVIVNIEYPWNTRQPVSDTPETGSHQYRPSGDAFTIVNQNGAMVAIALVDGHIVEFTEDELAYGIKFSMTSFDEKGTAAKPFLSGPLDEAFDERAEDEAAQDSYAESLRQLAHELHLTPDEQAALIDPDRYEGELARYRRQFGAHFTADEQSLLVDPNRYESQLDEYRRQFGRELPKISLDPSADIFGAPRTMDVAQLIRLEARVQAYQNIIARIRAADGTIRSYFSSSEDPAAALGPGTSTRRRGKLRRSDMGLPGSARRRSEPVLPWTPAGSGQSGYAGSGAEPIVGLSSPAGDGSAARTQPAPPMRPSSGRTQPSNGRNVRNGGGSLLPTWYRFIHGGRPGNWDGLPGVDRLRGESAVQQGPMRFPGSAYSVDWRPLECAQQVVHVAEMLGLVGAVDRGAGGNRPVDLQAAIVAQLAEEPFVAGARDPLAHVIAEVENPTSGVDTAVVLVDDGTNMHAYLVTDDGAGTAVIFDTNVQEPAKAGASGQVSHSAASADGALRQHIPRVRTKEDWQQSFAGVEFTAHVARLRTAATGNLVPAQQWVDSSAPRANGL